MKYFKIRCRAGHKRTIRGGNEITFYIASNTINEAIATAQGMPMVQHNRLPLLCKEIDYNTYQEHKGYNAYQNYLGIQYKKKEVITV